MAGVAELVDRAVALPPGPELSAVLGELAWEKIPNARLVEVLQARSRQLAHDQAELFAGMVEISHALAIADLPGGDRGEAVARAGHQFEWAAHEIAAGLTWTPTGTDREFGFATALVERLPLVYAALQQGRIDRGKARVFVEYLDPANGELTEQQTRRLCARFVPQAPGWTTKQLADRLYRALHAIDPELRRRRYQRAVQERGIALYLDPHTGTVTLAGNGLPPHEAAAAAERIDRLVDTVKRAGHPARRAQISADVYLGLLNGDFHGLDEQQIIDRLLATRRPEDHTDSTDDSTDDNSADSADDNSADSADDDSADDTATDDGADCDEAASDRRSVVETAAGDTGRGAAGPTANLGPTTKSEPTGEPGAGPTAEPGAGPAADTDSTAGTATVGEAEHGCRENTGFEGAPAASTGQFTDPSAAGENSGGRWAGDRVGVREGIEVRAGLATLAGLDDRPGQIPGLGPVGADTARAAAAAQQRGAAWMFALVDPHGHLLLAGRLRRRPHTHPDHRNSGGRGPERVRGGVVELHLDLDELQRYTRRPDPRWLAPGTDRDRRPVGPPGRATRAAGRPAVGPVRARPTRRPRPHPGSTLLRTRLHPHRAPLGAGPHARSRSRPPDRGGQHRPGLPAPPPRQTARLVTHPTRTRSVPMGEPARAGVLESRGAGTPRPTRPRPRPRPHSTRGCADLQRSRSPATSPRPAHPAPTGHEPGPTTTGTGSTGGRRTSVLTGSRARAVDRSTPCCARRRGRRTAADAAATCQDAGGRGMGSGSGGTSMDARRRAQEFCARYGLRMPILQAPMSGACPPELAIAVASAGGMGGSGVLLDPPERIAGWVERFREGSPSGSLQLNIWIPDPPSRSHQQDEQVRAFLSRFGPPGEPPGPAPDFDEQCEAMLAARPTVISSIMGVFRPEYVRALHERGIAWFACANTLDEARAAQEAGADAVVGQGMEAGGHRGTFDPDDAEGAQVGLFALIPRLVDGLRVPVIAAGGIADGRGVAAALTLGASAVQVGTALLRSPETGIDEHWAASLDGLAPEDTVTTRAYSGRLGRAATTPYVSSWTHAGAPRPAPYPEQRRLLTQWRRGIGTDEPATDRPALDRVNHWAGQSAALATDRPAAQIVSRMWQEAWELLPGGNVP